MSSPLWVCLGCGLCQCTGSGRMEQCWGNGHLCCIWVCQICGHHHCGRGTRVIDASTAEGEVTCPTAAAQFPVATEATRAGRPELCVLPPLLLQGSLGLQVQLPWPEDQDYEHCLCFSPSSVSCVPVHPPVDVHICGTL